MATVAFTIEASQVLARYSLRSDMRSLQLCICVCVRAGVFVRAGVCVCVYGRHDICNPALARPLILMLRRSRTGCWAVLLLLMLAVIFGVGGMCAQTQMCSV